MSQFLKQYGPSFFKALMLHGLLLAALFYSWPSVDKPVVKPVSYVKASLVQRRQEPPVVQKKEVAVEVKKTAIEQAALQAARKLAAKQAKEKLVRKQRKDQKLKEQKREEARKKEQATRAREKKAQQKMKAETERRQKLKDARAREEKIKLEKVRRDAQRLSQLTALREAELQQVKDQKIINKYILAIQQQVQRVWSRPPSARAGMEVSLRIDLIPGGEVTNVTVVDSSGNLAFDRSAAQAVYRLGTLPVPPEPGIFNRQFRNLILIFRPEDL